MTRAMLASSHTDGFGGSAVVRTAPGEGTEVELCLTRQEAAA